MRKLTLLWLLVLLWAVPSTAQTSVGPKALTGTTCPTACLAIDTRGMGSVTVQLSGSGDALVEGQVRVSDDYVTIRVTPVGGTTGVTSMSAPGAWLFAAGGFSSVRVRASSGTPTATLGTAASGGSSGGGGGGSATASLTLQETDDSSIASGQTADAVISFAQVYDGAVWRRLTIGTAGSPSAQVITVQGIASMTALKVDGTATTQPISATALPLPTNAATETTLSTAVTYLSLIANLSGTVGITGNTVPGNGMMFTGSDGSSIARYVKVDSSGNLQAAVLSIAAGTNNIGKVDINTVTPGTGATNEGKQEDAAHTTGDVGLMLLGVRQSSASDLSAGATNGDYEPFELDASGRLWVNCGTGCSGGTQYLEDAASASGDTVTLAGIIQQSSPVDTGGTNGDYTLLEASGGLLWVRMRGLQTPNGDSTLDDTLDAVKVTNSTASTATAYLTVRLSDGTSFLTAAQDQTEDAASAGGETGPLVMSIRQDTPAGTTSTDGDFQNLKTDSVGRLWVNCGTGCAGGTQFAEDAAHTTGDVGTVALAKRTDTAAVSSGTDGDYSTINVDASGRMWTHAGLVDTVTTVTTVSTLTTLSQLGGVALPIEDAAETAGGVGIYAMSVRRDTAASSASTTGDNATLNTDATGLLWTRGADPCNGATKVAVPINISTATTTQLVAASASNKIYVCAVHGIVAGADNVALVEDDTAACASPTAGMAGGVTAATGWNMAANEGLSVGDGNGSVAFTAATNRYVCFITSAAVQFSGTFVYALAP